MESEVSKPRTVEEAKKAFHQDPDYWSTFSRGMSTFLSGVKGKIGGPYPTIFGDYSGAYGYLSPISGKRTKEAPVLNYLNTLTIADRMMGGAIVSISLLTHNDADGLLDVLTKNLRENHEGYKSKGTDIRVISVAPRGDSTNKSYEDQFKIYEDIAKLSTGAPVPNRTAPPFLICDEFLLRLETDPEKLKNSKIDESEAHFSAYVDHLRKTHKTKFDAIWDKLNPDEKPAPEPKSLIRRLLSPFS